MSKRFMEYNPDQNYLAAIIAGKTFPPDSFEYFIVTMMHQMVLEEDFYPEKIDKGGAPAHNPKAILGIMFYAYSKGIHSYHKMAMNCHFNMPFLYISGYTTPDYSTISRFVQRFKKQIMNIFSKILYFAVDSGFIDYQLTATDGTKIVANASERFSGTLEDFEKRRIKLNTRIEQMLEKSTGADEEEDKQYWDRKIERYKELDEKISKFLKDAEKITKKDGKEVKQNITDKDARTMRLNGQGYKPGYNAQATVCAKNGLIVGADVTNQANDTGQLQPMLNQVEELAPPELKENIKNGTHLADNGYDTVANAVYAKENNLNILIPPGTTKELFNEKSKIDDKEKSIGTGHCKKIKTEKGGKLICPGGQELTKWTRAKSKGESYYEFRVCDRETCELCPFFDQCCGRLKDNKKKTFRIKVEMLDNLELIEENHKKIKSEKGQRLYSKRMGAIEKLFGHIKENIGMKQMLVRGKEKVTLAWNMLCITYNLQRMFNLISLKQT